LKLKKCISSGISSTLSNYYILINSNGGAVEYYIICTTKLKTLIYNLGIKKSCFNPKTLIYSNGYVIKKDKIITECSYYFKEILY